MFRGQVRGVPWVVEAVVLPGTPTVGGVATRPLADKDYAAGQIVGEATDYFAQDKRGNVWYLGEFTTHYVNGRLTDHADTWYAGVRGSRPGIIMPAEPRLGVPRY
jgi:hypothetical protein